MEKIRNFAYISAAIISGGLILFLFFKYLFGLFLPFMIACLVALATRAPAERLYRLTRIPERALRVLISLVITVVSLGTLALILYLAIGELWHFIKAVGEGDTLRAFLDKLTSGGLFGGAFASLGDVLYNLLISFATSLGSNLSGIVTAVPEAVLFIILTVIATVYFSLDIDKVKDAFLRILPKNIYTQLRKVKDRFFTVGIAYIKSYLLLMLITFSIVLVGLVILRRDYALVLALTIAVLDLLPVIGVGTVLLPWGAFEIILGDTAVGIGLVVLFLLHELVRQLVEPKIIGGSLGVHPILTLALFYFGYSLFGFVGILLVPITTVLINLALGKKNASEVDKSAGAE